MELHIENNVLLGFKRDGYMWLNGEPEYMHLVVPDTVTEIAEGAFAGCKEIVGVTIPGSVKNIGNEAFRFCTNLRDIVMEEGLERIGERAFEMGFFGDALILPDSLRSIGAGAFCDARMTTMRLPKNLNSIGAQAFYSCKDLESVSIPGTVKVIPKGAFAYCWYLDEVILAEGIQRIEADAFLECRNLPEIKIPQSLSYLDKDAVRDSNLEIIYYNDSGTFTVDDTGWLKDYQSTETNQVAENVWRCVDIPEGVRVIPEWAFRGCEILERLTFPPSLRVISTGGAGAFSWSKLPHVELPETLEVLGDFAFGRSRMCSVRIPRGLKSEYARQFKESSIGKLYLPEEFRADDTPRGFCEKYEWGKGQYGYIRSMNVNNVKIGEIVFE